MVNLSRSCTKSDTLDTPAYQPESKMRVQRFAIREEGYFSILQGLEMGWRGVGGKGVNTQKQVDPK